MASSVNPTTATATRPYPAHRAAGRDGSGRGSRADRSVRRDLEGLRAIAVLGVVIYHCKVTWLPGGFAGVDVFFVLSGFFITGLLLREAKTSSTIDLLAFWGRRARRLLPAAAVVMVATVVGGYVVADSIEAHRFAVDGIYASLFSVNWHYAALGTDYLSDPSPSPLTHYWSLGVEEQFYLVWPVLLVLLVLALRRYRPRVLAAGVAALALVAVVVSFLLAWHLTTGLQPYAYFATYSRVWQLGLGGLLAATAVGLGRLPVAVRVLLRWAGVATIIGFYVLAPVDIVYPGAIAAVPTLAAAAIIVSGLPRPGGAEVAPRLDPVWQTLRSRPSQLLGRYSYGWYLWHWPLLVLLPYARHGKLSPRGLIGCAVLSLLLAVVSYHVLEHPVRSSRRLVAHRGRWSLALGAALIVIGAGSAQAISSAADYASTHTDIKVANGTQLTPQPGLEAAKVGQPKKDGCEVSSREARLAPECRYLPDSGHGEVVLVGDSHAAQWFPAVDEIAKQRSWGLRVWTRQSCPIADVTKIYVGAPDENCNRWRENVIQRLIADRPSLVIMPQLANQINQEVAPNGKLAKGAAARRLWVAGMVKELKRLTAAHIPVLMIRDNPAFTQYGPQCALEHENDLQACSLPRSQALPEPVDLEAATQVPAVHVVDMTDAFCDQQRCYQIVGSILAYHDFGHITDVMSLHLAPRIDAAIDKMHLTS